MFDKLRRVIDPNEVEKKEKKALKENTEKFEKGDMPAIFLSALIVFLPLLILFIIGILLIALFFIR